MTQTTTVATVKNNSFLDERLSLDRLLRAVSEKQAVAIKTLADILKSTKSTDELKFKAASKLLEMQVELAEKISTDQINRLIAEYKFTQNPTGQVLEHRPNTPIVDFTTVQDPN